MRAWPAVVLAALLAGCMQPGANSGLGDDLCEAPLEHFQGRVDWANLTSGIEVEGLTFAMGPEHGLTTQLFDC